MYKYRQMAKNTYKGTFQPQHKEKYNGTYPIVYRSWWEACVMRWLDINKAVTEWRSESDVIVYFDTYDKKLHRYFMDFFFKTYDGKKFLIEVKPAYQTKVPKKPKRMTENYRNEVITYNKNMCKWQAAQIYAKKRNYIFQIWTEDTLKSLGVM